MSVIDCIATARAALEAEAKAGDARKKARASAELNAFDRLSDAVLKRTEQLAQRYIAQGVAPLAAEEAALKAALSRAAGDTMGAKVRFLEQLQTDLRGREFIAATRDARGRFAPYDAPAQKIDALDAAIVRHRTQLHGLMSDFVAETAPRFAGTVHPRAASDDVLEELFAPGAARSPDAKGHAGAFRAAQEYYVNLLRGYGIHVPLTDDYVPLTHSPGLVIANGGSEGADFIAEHMAWIDWGKAEKARGSEFVDDTERRQFLHDIWRKKAFGAAARQEQRPVQFHERMTQARYIFYKDAAAWKAAARKYGSSDNFAHEVTSLFDTWANDLAILEHFGPNPRAGADRFTHAVRFQSVEAGASARGEKATQKDSAWSRALSRVMGDDQPTADTAFARASDLVAHTLTGAYLAGVTPTAVLTDSVTLTATAMRLQMLSPIRVMRNVLSTMVDRSNVAKRKYLRAGIMFDTFVSSSASVARVTGELMPRSWVAKLSDVPLRASLLTSWTESVIAGTKSDLMHTWSTLAQQDWGRLSPLHRAGFEQYRITEADWNDFRRAVPDTTLGYPILNPQSARTIDGISPARQEELFRKFHEMVYVVGHESVLHASLRARSQLPGAAASRATWSGQLLRSSSSYLTFAASIYSRMWLPTITAALRQGGGMWAVPPAYFLMLWGAGIMAEQFYQLSKGRTPLDWDPTTEGGQRLYSAGLVRGGPLGIFGDYAYSSLNSYGSLSEKVAGPLVGFLQDTAELTAGNLATALDGKDPHLTADLLLYLDRVTPGSSLWYARILKEELLFDGALQWVDPETYSRKKRAQERTMRDLGQTRLTD